MVEREQEPANKQAHKQDRGCQAVYANSARLECGHFVVLSENAETDQRGHQRSDRRKIVDQHRSQIPKVIDHCIHAYLDLYHVAEQLEKSENLDQSHQRQQHTPQRQSKPLMQLDGRIYILFPAQRTATVPVNTLEERSGVHLLHRLVDLQIFL